MSDKPLSYDALKAVLKHLKPNMRVQVACQIPSLKKTERIVPIRFSQVVFDEFSTTIDDTKYQLGIYQEYHNEEETPLSVRRHNSEGGYRGDIDEHGKLKGFDDAIPTEGDLVLWDAPMKDETIWDDEWERAAKRELEEMKKNYPNPKGLIPYMMDTRKVKLDLYNCKKNGIPLPFTQYIRLTITSPEGVRIESIKYEGKKLHEASKHLNSVLFGDRKQSMSADFFAIPAYVVNHYLPAGFKIKVNHLQLDIGILDKLKASGIFLESSFPLSKLTIMASTRKAPLLLEHDFSKDAQTLEIANSPFSEDSWAAVLPNFQNKHLILKHQKRDYDERDYLPLIRNWIQNGRPLGTKFSFGVLHICWCYTFLGLVRREFEATAINSREASIKMVDQTKKLMISYEEAEPEVGEKLMKFVCGYEPKWFVRVEVVAATEI